MIIGYNFYGYDMEGTVWDTPIPTEMIDQMRMFEGIYDKVYIDLDTDIEPTNDRFDGWDVKTIINADFEGDLDAGTIGAEGFKITHVQIMRSVLGSGKWETVSVHDYNIDYNVYQFIDRYVPNGITYEYAIAPIANEIVGEKLIAEPVEVSYDGILITDSENNFNLQFNTELGDIQFNTNQSTTQPLNSVYPILTVGSTKYRTGTITTMPISPNNVANGGEYVDSLEENVYRQKIIDFLNNGKAKVMRIDNGTLMLVMTSNVKQTHLEGSLQGLANILFDYVEIEEVNFKNQLNNGLVNGSHLSKITFDEFGGVVIDN